MSRRRRGPNDPTQAPPHEITPAQVRAFLFQWATQLSAVANDLNGARSWIQSSNGSLGSSAGRISGHLQKIAAALEESFGPLGLALGEAIKEAQAPPRRKEDAPGTPREE